MDFMKKAVILHGTDGNHKENWFPWLKNELELREFNVWSPDLPQADEPSIKRYNKFLLKKNDWEFDQDTILIGHSSGAVAILGLLQDLPKDISVDTCYLVGAFKDDLGWDSLKNLFDDPFDFNLIKTKAKQFIFIHSDNDPYCPLDHAKFLSKELNGILIKKKKQKHFSVGTMGKQYLQFPDLLNLILQEQERKEMNDRLKDKINKLKSGKAKKAYQVNPSIIDTYKARDTQQIKIKVDQLLPIVQEIKIFVQDVRKYVTNIWDQDEKVASYLLLGKAFSNLEITLQLAKQGKCIEMIDIARSAHESIDMLMAFTSPKGKKYLTDWFNGKTINNQKVRKVLGELVNEISVDKQKYYEIKTKVYGIYSMYSHSNYPALFDYIDVFREDFDFNGGSGFHYTNSYFDAIVTQLVINILLALKNIHVFTNDQEKLNRIEKLLKVVGHINLSKTEIEQITREHNL